MVVSDPTIDPITGLPVLNPSGPVQQIPLGQEVFPYADLNATAQPTRGPIYGDDIIPTSSLVTAPDAQMKPRSVQATTTRELRVREAVFQNLGAAIPDGTTAPVDVNVVSGGGGGGGSLAPITDPQSSGYFHGTSPFALIIHQFTVIPFTIYGWSIGYVIDTAGWSPPIGSSIQMYVQGDQSGKQLYLAGGYMKFQVTENVTEMIEHRLDWPYYAPIKFTTATFPADTSVTLHLNCQNIDISFSGAVLYA